MLERCNYIDFRREFTEDRWCEKLESLNSDLKAHFKLACKEKYQKRSGVFRKKN